MYGSISPHLDVLMRDISDLHSCHKYMTIYLFSRIFYIEAKTNLSQFFIEEKNIFTVSLHFGFLLSSQNYAKLVEFWQHCAEHSA